MAKIKKGGVGMKGKIFNAQEAQSILNGSKVMFRGVIKPQPEFQSQYVINAIRLIDKCPYQEGNAFVENAENGKLLE